MTARGILRRVLRALTPRSSPTAAQRPLRSSLAASVAPVIGATSTATKTIEVDSPGRNALRLVYAPHIDGNPDAGEIVWTWVPYAENDGRGKDRPVLVIARAPGPRVYAVRLTSRERDGDRDYLPIGSGSWDSRGRSSWVDIDQLYSVHPEGMRREAAALDAARFEGVARALQRRYGWRIED